MNETVRVEVTSDELYPWYEIVTYNWAECRDVELPKEFVEKFQIASDLFDEAQDEISIYIKAHREAKRNA